MHKGQAAPNAPPAPALNSGFPWQRFLLLPVHTTGSGPPPALGLQRYRYRLVVDESISVGVLGQHGRGAAEEAGYAPEDVEIVGGSMSEWRACLLCVQSP